jgi:hypothetical protein
MDFHVTDEKGDPLLHVQGNFSPRNWGVLTIQLVRSPQQGRPATYTVSTHTKKMQYICRVRAPGQEEKTKLKDVTATFYKSLVHVGDRPFMKHSGDTCRGSTYKLVLPEGVADSGSRESEGYKYKGVVAQTSTKLWDVAPETRPKGPYYLLRCGPGVDALLCILACICKSKIELLADSVAV